MRFLLSPHPKDYSYHPYRIDLVTGITDPALHAAGNWALGYDDSGDRLVSANGDFGVLGYSYDNVGNRLSETRAGVVTNYGYSATSQQLQTLSQNGTALQSYGYDANGNITTQASAAFTFGFGADNRLRTVQKNGQPLASYTYDGQGRRITKTVNGSTRQFYYDLDGSLLREGNGRIYLDVEDVPLAMVDAGSVYYLHPDRLGTVQRITDANKQVVWSGRYEPFGKVAISASIDYRLRFPGQYFDAETGLYYNYFRDYDPGVGRYRESDPIGLRGGVNTYGYVGGNPLKWIDAFGLTQDDINAARKIAKQSQPDLDFPPDNRFGTRDLNRRKDCSGTVGSTYPGIGTFIDDCYLKKLNDAQACDLLDTIIHEGVHYSLQSNDPRQNDDDGNGYPYSEARKRTTPGLCKQLNQIRKNKCVKSE